MKKILIPVVALLALSNQANAVTLLNNDAVDHSVLLVTSEGEERFLIEASQSYEVCTECTIKIGEESVAAKGDQTVAIKDGKPSLSTEVAKKDAPVEAAPAEEATPDVMPITEPVTEAAPVEEAK